MRRRVDRNGNGYGRMKQKRILFVYVLNEIRVIKDLRGVSVGIVLLALFLLHFNHNNNTNRGPPPSLNQGPSYQMEIMEMSSLL